MESTLCIHCKTHYRYQIAVCSGYLIHVRSFALGLSDDNYPKKFFFFKYLERDALLEVGGDDNHSKKLFLLQIFRTGVNSRSERRRFLKQWSSIWFRSERKRSLMRFCRNSVVSMPLLRKRLILQKVCCFFWDRSATFVLWRLAKRKNSGLMASEQTSLKCWTKIAGGVTPYVSFI